MAGSDTHRIFEIKSGVTTIIKNATITGINAEHNHSSVFHNLGILTVENCILKKINPFIALLFLNLMLILFSFSETVRS